MTETAERSQSIDKLPLAKRSASSRSQAELRALLTRLIGSLAAAQGTRCVERVVIDRWSATSGVWHLSCRTARQRCAERQVPYQPRTKACARAPSVGLAPHDPAWAFAHRAHKSQILRACTRSRLTSSHPDTSSCPQESSWTTIDASSTPETSTPPPTTADAKIYRKFDAHEPSVRASSPFLCPAHPVSSARGRLSGHQRTHIAKLMPLSLPFRFLDPTLTLQHHTVQLTLFRSTLSSLNRFTASHRPRHPFCTGYRLSAAPTCLQAPILGAVDACATSRAQNGAPRPVSTPLHRTRALRARCFCELQPLARASAQGAPLEGLGSNPGVARRYLTAPDR